MQVRLPPRVRDKRLVRLGYSVYGRAIISRLRGYKVLLDTDLAALYGVETRVLNQAVKRNFDRFPADFMFQLSA